MFRVEGLSAFYGKSQILWDVSLEVERGEVVGLLGRNGVGKTTLLRSIMGLVDQRSGRVRFEGRDISGLAPHKIPRFGIGYVPQERGVFAEFTVLENLRVASPGGELDAGVLQSVFHYFPVLDERMSQLAGTLSGGERQMLAIARAFVKHPRLMLLDEPTEGLMPSAVETVERAVQGFGDGGMAVLLVEQNVNTALAVCGRIYVMEKGAIVREERASETSEEVLGRYMGVGL
ncbi:MAG: ABC transporter ATP-binding protein [Candidatus Tectomicrobia bacterium]|nr:ABC transporter ATP-binding protein [Candidatus Tectomicrobia bacterium]